MPKVSVIMPAYNAEKYIREAIDSILQQTFSDFEFIILNDCSADKTEEIILSYTDPRIRYSKNDRNCGVAATLNRGLALARGTYIARMDADDISLPERFEKQVAYLDAHDSVAVLGCGIELFRSAAVVASGWYSADAAHMKVDLLFSCGLAHPSVMMRTDIIRSLGGYDPEFDGMEDYELWCRTAETYEIVTLRETLLRYRLHENQVTRHPSPEHTQRRRRLKERQLNQLGLDLQTPQTEAFFRYCLGGRKKTAEEVLLLQQFFILAMDANARRDIYHPEILAENFRSILMQAVLNLPQQEQKAAAAHLTLIHKNDIRLHKAKQIIKKIIRRKA